MSGGGTLRDSSRFGNQNGGLTASAPSTSWRGPQGHGHKPAPKPIPAPRPAAKENNDAGSGVEHITRGMAKTGLDDNTQDRDLRADLDAKRQSKKNKQRPQVHNDEKQQQQQQRTNKPQPQNRGKKGRNTQDFSPSTEPPALKVVLGNPAKETLGRKLHGRHVVYVPNFFCDEEDVSVYDRLLEEVKAGGSADMWVPWHENSHFIANDRDRHGKWKQESPIFRAVIHRITTYFNMDVKATRFNWYRDAEEWKPYHHDAAAVKPERAKTQNCTVAVSFGATRDAAFEHAKTGTTVWWAPPFPPLRTSERRRTFFYPSYESGFDPTYTRSSVPMATQERGDRSCFAFSSHGVKPPFAF